MSFGVTGRLNTSRLRFGPGAVRAIEGELRDALDQVRKEGEDFLKSIVPVDRAYLFNSARGGTNQVTVWWSVKVAPDPDRPSTGYAVFQNRGWTDRAGNFHEGHFFMERTQAFAQHLMWRMTGDVLARNGFIGAMYAMPGGFSLENLGTLGQFRGPQQGPRVSQLPRRYQMMISPHTSRASGYTRAVAAQARRDWKARGGNANRTTATRTTRDAIEPTGR